MAQSFDPSADSRQRQSNLLERVLPGGTAGNARLTSLTGLVLIVLLFVEGLTILRIRALITPHAFIGFMLIPPVCLKLASVTYRFGSYYVGRPSYRAVGPPQILQRMLGPFLVAVTILLFASGVILIVSVPGDAGPWRRIHTLSFILWFGLTSIHVLSHLGRAVTLSWAEIAARHAPALGYAGTRTSGSAQPQTVPGRFDRSALVIGSVLLGIALAVAFLPWDNTWATWLSAFRGDG